MNDHQRQLLDRLNRAAGGEITWTYFGGGLPVQGDGSTPDGDKVYFRFRHNCAQLYVGGDRLDETRLYAELEDIYTGPDGEPEDLKGVFDSDDEAVEVVERLRAELKPLSQWPDGTRVDRMSRALRALVEHLAKKEEQR